MPRDKRDRKISPMDLLREASAHPSEGEAVMVAMDDITIDAKVQVRVDGLDERTVTNYVYVLSVDEDHDGDLPQMEPIILFDMDGELILSSGFHRYEAYTRCHRAEIPAIIRRGADWDEVMEEAEASNLEHGKQLSYRDKCEILRRRVERGHDWAELSNRELGRILGVDHKTIGGWLKGFEIARKRRKSADGRVMDVSGIQGSNAGRAEDPKAKQRLRDKLQFWVDKKALSVSQITTHRYEEMSTDPKDLRVRNVATGRVIGGATPTPVRQMEIDEEETKRAERVVNGTERMVTMSEHQTHHNNYLRVNAALKEASFSLRTISQIHHAPIGEPTDFEISELVRFIESLRDLFVQLDPVLARWLDDLDGEDEMDGVSEEDLMELIARMEDLAGRCNHMWGQLMVWAADLKVANND